MKAKMIIFLLLMIAISWTQQIDGSAVSDSIFKKNLDVYWNRGWEAYQEGDYHKAISIYKEGLQYDITNGSNLYNLACCYGLTGNSRKAAEFLKYSINNGFDNYDHIVNDQDFDKVKDSEEFTAVVDSLSRYLDKKKNPEVKEIWFSSDAYVKAYLRLPDDYDESKTYPLVIGLHGYGATGESFMRIWDMFEKQDFIYICPETFYPFSLGKKIGYSWFTWTDDEAIDKEIADKTHEYIVKVTRKMQSIYKIDRTYLLGFSQGCGLAYTTGIKQRELYDGLMCFGGWLDTEILNDEMIEKANDLKVFIAHGNQDKMVEFDSGIKAKEKLSEYGYEFKFHEFDGGHTVPEEAVKEAQEWLGF